MKRSLIITMLFLLSFGGVFAENSVCIKPKLLSDENNNKDYIYYRIRLGVSPVAWKIEPNTEDLLKYYIDCLIESKEEKQIFIDMLLMHYFDSVMIRYDIGNIFSEGFIPLVEQGEKALSDLKKYGKNNENYEFYLGRYSFFTGIGYYNEGQYKKALEYLTIGFDKQNIEFKYPKYFFITDKTSEDGKTININTGTSIIYSYFFNHFYTNKYKDFGRKWVKIDNQLLNMSSLELID